MTHKKFEELFHTKYPNGTTYAHDVFENGVPGRVQKVAVEFVPGGKVYKYAGAYEDILCKIGVNVISKERFYNLVDNLSRRIEENGKKDEFFWFMVDNTEEIERLTAEVEKYRNNYLIV